ncbi:hypothetical protein LSTR_LSTR010896 [Laodelphax striatellus]|uniref:Uncharacterized protein n=1 Tax=Laodelphax striatellus TaxID=195883 RepID=A0A482XKM1_LAOST|nr:hypothetical protein LSTR_LSTR010896 [Laodelphax striatellus]
MRAPVVDTAPLPAVVSSSSSAAPVHNSSSNHISNSNSSNNNNNVSLVRCYGAGVASVPSIDCVVASSSSTNPVVRTFTSTEAQTDDVVVDTAAVVRPRERRRHHNRRQQPPVPPTTTPLTDRLPDILNSHLPPPYTTLPPPPPPHLGLPPSIPVLTAVPPPGSPPPPLQHTPAAVSNLVAGLRFPFAIVPAARRRSRQYASSDEPKSCCGVAVSQAASVRWLMLLVLLVGLCCAFVGTLLLVTRAAGRDHLTLALLIIGVGVVLVGVSAAAWRLTSQEGAASCRAMLGLAGPDELGASEPNRRFVPRLPPSYGRPHHPYAAMMYPEFQYRAPPPSYQASMQEYRLRLLLLDRHTTPVTNSMSPPPTYRSQAGSLLRAPIVTNRRDLIHYQMAASQQSSDYSRPPSYRSRTSCSRSEPRGGGGPGGDSLSSHSRDPSQLSMTSDAGGVTAPPTVITVMGGHHEEAEPIIKLAPGDEGSLSPIAPKDDSKDGNLVTIVQTSSQSTGPVIVTISGNADDGQCSRDTEMEILAHL